MSAEIRRQKQAARRKRDAAEEMYRKLEEWRDSVNCVCRINKIVASLGAGIPCIRCELDAMLKRIADGRPA